MKGYPAPCLRSVWIGDWVRDPRPPGKEGSLGRLELFSPRESIRVSETWLLQRKRR